MIPRGHHNPPTTPPPHSACSHLTNIFWANHSKKVPKIEPIVTPYKLSMDSNPAPSKRVKYGHADFEATLLVHSGGSDIESDGDYIPSDHDTKSEVDFDEEDNEYLGEIENPENVPSGNYVYGKNRFKWCKDSPVPKNTRTLQHNIVVKCPEHKRNDIYSADAEQPAQKVLGCFVISYVSYYITLLN
ncbi:unnamed protein product [Acanthoscelides obtectus]|uniref:Uncharacterized protein n=1 Tax=Acanthoscelides obtectus TaxID=200917 RepID=A0A9P0K4A3_ACAOB|nr:unnamed protein product [Acanthoscelides obtectus]CAK1668889.1 hypothetical protein AOBTE_LOCUS26664 [Acanthoscelides obtectus]